MRLLLLSILLGATVPTADAQSLKTRLEKTEAIYLTIEPLTNDQKLCGLNETDIRRSFMFPVSMSNLSIKYRTKPEEHLPEFYIVLTTIGPSGGLCFTLVNMELHDYNLYQEEDKVRTESIIVDDLLWSDQHIFYSTPSIHQRQIGEIIEGLAKKFVTSWNLSRKH